MKKNLFAALSITPITFTLNGTVYSRKESGYCQKRTPEKVCRISVKEFEEAEAKAAEAKAEAAASKPNRKEKRYCERKDKRCVYHVLSKGTKAGYVQLDWCGKPYPVEVADFPLRYFPGWDKEVYLNYAWAKDPEVDPNALSLTPPMTKTIVTPTGKTKTYIFTGVGNGGGKKGSAIYLEFEFWKRNRRFLATPWDYGKDKEKAMSIELQEMEAWAEWSKTPKSEWVKRSELRSKAEKLRAERRVLIKGSNGKITTPVANQLRAQLVVPCTKFGNRIPITEIEIRDDIVREGRKGTDGQMVMSDIFAAEYGLPTRPGSYQVRNLRTNLTDDTEEGIPVFVKGVNTVVRSTKSFCVLYLSTVKTKSSDKSQFEEYLQLARMEAHAETGKITLGRQIEQQLFMMATKSQINALMEPAIEEAKGWNTREGYIKLVNILMPETKRAKWKDMVFSRAMWNSARKYVAYAFADLCAGKFPIPGAESLIVVDNNALANQCDGGNRPELTPGVGVAISKRQAKKLGLHIGMWIVVWRHPFANPRPTMRRIERIDDDAEGVIQVALCDRFMDELDADFDGDHAKWSGDKTIVAIAKRMARLCDESGADILPPIELEASEETRVSEFDEYATWFYACGGDVGVQSAKMADEAALIPFPLPRNPKKASRLLANNGGWRVFEVLRGEQESKRKICIAADECKKGTKDEEEVEFITRLDKVIRSESRPESHFWAHPEEYQMIRREGTWGIQKLGDDESWKPFQTGRNVMRYIRQHVMQELCGSPFCPPVSRDEEDDRYGQLKYSMVDCTGENPHGFLYVPTQEDLEMARVDEDKWFIKTGFSKLDDYVWSFSLGDIHKWQLPAEGITIPERWKPGKEDEKFAEVTITNENLIDYFTNGWGEADENNDGLSFEKNEYLRHLSPAIYLTRLRRLISDKTAELSAPLKKIEVKCDPYILATDMIYVCLNKAASDCKKVDWITCRKILFDDLGDYMFSGKQTESSAGDWRAFFNEFGCWLK